MSYLAQGSLLDDLREQTFEAFPHARIAGLVVERGKIAHAWPVSQVEYPREAAVDITRAVTDALGSLQQEVVNFQVEGFFIAASLQARINLALNEFKGAVGSCISSTPPGGTARCPRLRSATLRVLDAIIDYYEKLGESAARAQHDPSNVSMVEEMFVKLYKFGRSVVRGTKAVIEAAKDVAEAAGKGMSMTIELIKWGSIAGGLFILYWYVLRPQGKK